MKNLLNLGVSNPLTLGMAHPVADRLETLGRARPATWRSRCLALSAMGVIALASAPLSIAADEPETSFDVNIITNGQSYEIVEENGEKKAYQILEGGERAQVALKTNEDGSYQLTYSDGKTVDIPKIDLGDFSEFEGLKRFSKLSELSDLSALSRLSDLDGLVIRQDAMSGHAPKRFSLSTETDGEKKLIRITSDSDDMNPESREKLRVFMQDFLKNEALDVDGLREKLGGKDAKIIRFNTHTIEKGLADGGDTERFVFKLTDRPSDEYLEELQNMLDGVKSGDKTPEDVTRFMKSKDGSAALFFDANKFPNGLKTENASGASILSIDELEASCESVNVSEVIVEGRAITVNCQSLAAGEDYWGRQAVDARIAAIMASDDIDMKSKLAKTRGIMGGHLIRKTKAEYPNPTPREKYDNCVRDIDYLNRFFPYQSSVYSAEQALATCARHKPADG